MSLSLSSPLSLYSIPLIWVIGFYPNILKVSLIVKATGSIDTVKPRENVARLASMKVDPEIAARAARMESAHMNGNETFPLWAVSILAGNFAQIDHQTLNIVAASYITLRILYNQIYINQKTPAQGNMRTLVWITGISLPLYLLVKAANLVRLK